MRRIVNTFIYQALHDHQHDHQCKENDKEVEQCADRIRIHVFRITYAELLQLFEYSMTRSGRILLTQMTGLDCYFTSTERTSSSGRIYYEHTLHSLAKDGTTIYQNGQWTSDWSSRTLTVAVSEYVATTDREDRDAQLHNPFVEWCKTSRLVSNDLIDNENAVRVLTAEAEANNGLLSIDTRPHFILYTE